jgi:hypothetical protein
MRREHLLNPAAQLRVLSASLLEKVSPGRSRNGQGGKKQFFK